LQRGVLYLRLEKPDNYKAAEAGIMPVGRFFCFDTYIEIIQLHMPDPCEKSVEIVLK